MFVFISQNMYYRCQTVHCTAVSGAKSQPGTSWNIEVSDSDILVDLPLLVWSSEIRKVCRCRKKSHLKGLPAVVLPKKACSFVMFCFNHASQKSRHKLTSAVPTRDSELRTGERRALLLWHGSTCSLGQRGGWLMNQCQPGTVVCQTVCSQLLTICNMPFQNSDLSLPPAESHTCSFCWDLNTSITRSCLRTYLTHSNVGSHPQMRVQCFGSSLSWNFMHREYVPLNWK